MELDNAETSHAAIISRIALRESINLLRGKNMAMNRSAAIIASVNMAALIVQNAKNPCSLQRILPGQPV